MEYISILFRQSLMKMDSELKKMSLSHSIPDQNKYLKFFICTSNLNEIKLFSNKLL